MYLQADLLSREEQEDTTTSYSSDEFVSSNKAEDGQDLGDDEVFSTEELLPIKATLVIMPLSVLRQWQTTIETQVQQSFSKFCLGGHSTGSY